MFRSNKALKIGAAIVAVVMKRPSRGGVSCKIVPFDLGLAYVNNMAHNRVGYLLGTNSRSIFLTITLDYESLKHTN